MKMYKYILFYFMIIAVVSSRLIAQVPQRLFYINVASISASRDGFAMKPKITVNWDVYNVGNNSTLVSQYSQVGELTYTLILSDSATGATVDSGTTKEFSYTFEKRLSYNKKYKIDFAISSNSPSVQLIKKLSPPSELKGLPFVFWLKRDRWRNSFTSFWGGIFNFFVHSFFQEFIAKGGPFGTVICTIILILFLLTILNIFAFWNRLFVKIIPSQKIERVFPKNTNIRYKSEIMRLFSFKHYTKQNEFINQILKCFRNEKDYNKVIEIFRKEENRSIANNILRKPIQSLFELKKEFDEKYSYMIFERTQQEFEKVMTLEIEKLKGVLGKCEPAGETSKNSEKRKTYTMFFSMDAFWIIGAIAPMLGLFGTVLGIASAFGKISFLEAARGTKIATLLAGDIQLALNTTILGLIVGVVAIFCYYYFKKQLESLELELKQVFTSIIDNIKSRGGGGNVE